MLSREAKKAQVIAISEAFSRSKANFLVNCIGLNVEKITELRKKLKQNQGDIQVIRNSLSLRAMENHQTLKQAYSDQMEGPNAFVLAFGDGIKVAKIIDEFSKENEVFQIKGAVLDGDILNLEQVKTLAQLASLDVLQANFLRLLSAPLSKFLSTIKEVPQSFARLLSAEKDKRA